MMRAFHLFCLFIFTFQFLIDVSVCDGSWEVPLWDERGRPYTSLPGLGRSVTPRPPRSLPRLEVSPNYDSESPPPKINGTGVPVKFSVLIFSVRGINEIAQEITIEMRLQIWWIDTRVADWKNRISPGKKYVSVTQDIDAKLWHPDIFIDFVKEIVQPKLLGATPISLRFYRNGFLRTSTRVTIKMACPMAFHYYPADKQACRVPMKSYAYTNDVLQIMWDEGRNKLSLFKPGMELPNFVLGLQHPETPNITTSSSNFYSSIQFTVLLKRKLSYHFIQTYIPSSLFVIISWLSFLVPPESVPGRMAICMTTLLSQATMFAGIRQSIPKVSYVKALDIWMVACVFFVFLTLVEYALILKLRSRIPKEQRKQVRKASCATPQQLMPELQVPKLVQANAEPSHNRDERGSIGKTFTLLCPDAGISSIPRRGASGESEALEIPVYNKYADVVKTMEQYTWLLCILLFVLFNLVYWPWLLTSAGYYDKFGEDLFYKT